MPLYLAGTDRPVPAGDLADRIIENYSPFEVEGVLIDLLSSYLAVDSRVSVERPRNGRLPHLIYCATGGEM